MAILFKKTQPLSLRFQTGGATAPIDPPVVPGLGDKAKKTSVAKGAENVTQSGLNPYIRAGAHKGFDTYLNTVMGDARAKDNYSYQLARDGKFVENYSNDINTHGANRTFLGNDSTPMFTLRPGSSVRRGSKVNGAQEYYIPDEAPSKVITVGDYRKNPAAYKYAVDSKDLDEFNQYLGL